MATLHIVHCIDTEGPLTEDLEATFERINSTFDLELPANIKTLKQLQQKEISLGGCEAALAEMIAPDNLAYNSSWMSIRTMLLDMLSPEFRNKQLDDFGKGWVYSWHCMDHMYYNVNPRRKITGYGEIFRFYNSILKETNSLRDEINWHFHPTSLTKNPTHCATSYANSYPLLLEILCRRIIEDNWFPTVNRPGFHSERPDSHAFMEQWIPYDYANQSCEIETTQPDLSNGRFGDWRRAPKTWRGYHPSHDDYQQEGRCKRKIFRCLNVGTRLRLLKETHVAEAFKEAYHNGDAVLAFTNHDYRDMRKDVEQVRAYIRKIKPNFESVKICYSGAEEAAREIEKINSDCGPKLKLSLCLNKLNVKLVQGQLFGPQPFLAIEDKSGNFYHDNFDIQSPNKFWSYIFDEQTFTLDKIKKIGVASAGRYGHYCCEVITL